MSEENDTHPLQHAKCGTCKYGIDVKPQTAIAAQNVQQVTECRWGPPTPLVIPAVNPKGGIAVQVQYQYPRISNEYPACWRWEQGNRKTKPSLDLEKMQKGLIGVLPSKS